MLLEYDLNEVLRYLGYRGASADRQTLGLIGSVHKELCEVCSPKYIFREYEFQKTDSALTINGISFKSKKLCSHLKNSDTVALFPATLGTGADTLIKKYSVCDKGRAAVAQATAASMTETLCDIGCMKIKESCSCEIRPRFSPGFSDLELSSQRDFFKLLDVSKRLGVTLTESCLMVPTKSVTAFVGIIKEK